jgi:hypothetical protein
LANDTSGARSPVASLSTGVVGAPARFQTVDAMAVPEELLPPREHAGQRKK